MITPIHLNRDSHVNSFIEQAKQAIDDDNIGFCIIRNQLTSPEELLGIVNKQIAKSFTISSGKDGKVFYDTVADRGTDTDSKNTVLSTTNEAFPLHTDCSYLERPADVVTLYCVQNSYKGGESIATHINSILKKLTPQYINFLLETPFPFYSVRYPILEKSKDGYYVRFSQVELMASVSDEECAVIANQLAPFIGELNDPANYTTYKLNPNDCLIVNNRTCLHGRTAFEDNSERLFYRMRQYHIE